MGTVKDPLFVPAKGEPGFYSHLKAAHFANQVESSTYFQEQLANHRHSSTRLAT